MLLPALPVSGVVSFTMPDTIPASCDSLSGVSELDNGGPGYTMGARLERLRSDEFAWVVVDSISGVPPGARGVFMVELVGCRPCAYRAWTVDAAGNVACKPSNILNLWEIGPPVGIGDQTPPHIEPEETWRTYDVGGRHLERAPLTGMMWERSSRGRVRRVLMLDGRRIALR